MSDYDESTIDVVIAAVNVAGPAMLRSAQVIARDSIDDEKLSVLVGAIALRSGYEDLCAISSGLHETVEEYFKCVTRNPEEAVAPE